MSRYIPVGKDKRKKLSEDQVREIRKLFHEDKFSTYEIALKFSLTQSIVWRCVSRESYDNVK